MLATYLDGLTVAGRLTGRFPGDFRFFETALILSKEPGKRRHSHECRPRRRTEIGNAVSASIGTELSYTERRMPGGGVSVTLRGDLDVSAAPTVRERLRATLDAMPATRGLTIDLSRVFFCDAAGLAVLVGGYRRARALGITITLTGVRPQVTQVLHVTGLDRVFATLTNPPFAQAGPPPRLKAV